MANKRGVIQGFKGSWGSGIGYLIVDGQSIPCDNAPTVRALQACFGNAIGPGHTVNEPGFVGKEIVYSTDDFGLLAGFTPAEDFEGEIEAG